jgi:hypothetical protein
MEEVLELDLPKRAIIVANTGFKPKGMGKVASSKLTEANEFLDKHPIPAWIFMSRYSQIQQEEGICIEGILKFADAEASTVTVVVTVNEYAKTNYPIHTTTNTANQLIKTYLGKTINVRIRPQINSDNQFQYELMAIN